MQELIDIFVSCFNILNNIKVLNISLLVWSIIPILIGLLVQFLKGKKEQI